MRAKALCVWATEGTFFFIIYDENYENVQTETRWYLDLALAVVHHAVLRGHGAVGVQAGGVEGDLGHLGDAPEGVGLGGACGLVPVLPVAEELLEQRGLAPCWKHLDLQGKGNGSLRVNPSIHQ